MVEALVIRCFNDKVSKTVKKVTSDVIEILELFAQTSIHNYTNSNEEKIVNESVLP